MHAHRTCCAVCYSLLCSMDSFTITCIQFFLGLLLVPLMDLDGARGPCPSPCRCTLRILNCNRITTTPGFRQVPLPRLAGHPCHFTHLDFTGNSISSIRKVVWNACPWAESLVLKGNRLGRIQISSLDSLLSLTHLDLSYNKIRLVESNAFEAVPFLQVLNLSGNLIEQITEGTFRPWHGMQFLLKVDLSHNSLAVIQDPYFYSLPSLKLLDVGATKVMPRIFEDLLETSLQLQTLVLPREMFCCLCRMKKDIEVLGQTIHLKCTESCEISAALCKNEEPLSRMPEEAKKVLEIRKRNGRSLLNIFPEGAVPDNVVPERSGPRNEHPSSSAPPPQDFVAPQDEFLLQVDLFERELNKKLDFIISKAPVRQFISHIIHILKTDCTAPRSQMACSELVSRAGLLLERLATSTRPPPYGNVHETSSLWRSYFWPSRNETSMSEGSPKKLEQPSDRRAGHGMSEYGYENRMLVAVSVTVTIMIMAAVICLNVITSRCSAAKVWSFLGRKRTPQADEELPRTPFLLMDNWPLWLKAVCHLLNEAEKNIMIDEEPLEEAHRGRWGIGRLYSGELTMKEASSDQSSVPTLELLTSVPPAIPPLPPIPPSSTPPQKLGVKKGSAIAGETSEATSSKAASSAPEEDGDKEEEDEGDSAEKSEGPTTEATSDTPESGEADEEEESE